jgi:hypothetical protein
MITATEHAAYLGYTIGYDLPLEDRRNVAALAASDDRHDLVKLDRIIAAARPDCPRGLRVLPGQADYETAFRSNFLDGATAPGQHRKLVDA